jgi:hypothetical protein
MKRTLTIAMLLTAGLSAWSQAAYDPSNPKASTSLPNYQNPTTIASTTQPYVFKADGEGAIVWSGNQCKTFGIGHESRCAGINGVHADASSIVIDPLTGNALRQISYKGVTVTAALRSQALGSGCDSACWTVYFATLTFVNNTEYPLKIDGDAFTATLPPPNEKEIKKWWGKKTDPSSFAPRSAIVQPGGSSTLSFYMMGVASRGYGGSFTGCSTCSFYVDERPVDVVSLRFSIRVNGKDFVFPWLAPIWENFASVPQWDH